MAKKKGVFGSIMNYIWNKSMAGKKESLINSYDNDPEVAAAIKDLNKSKDGLLSAVEKSKALRNSK